MGAYTQRKGSVNRMSKRMREWIGSIPTEVREQLVKLHTGSSRNYVLKRVYTAPLNKLPTFKMKIAVGLDKASRGKFDFRDLIAESDGIDWDYVRRALNSRMKT